MVVRQQQPIHPWSVNAPITIQGVELVSVVGLSIAPAATSGRDPPVPVIAAPLASSAVPRRTAIIGAALALIAVVAIAILDRPDLVDNGRNAFNRGAATIGSGVSEGLGGVKSFASMLADRSPGKRTEGALASTKHKTLVPLHQRALPKARGPAPAGAPPFSSLVAAPPVPPSPAPLYNVMTGPPALVAQAGPPVGVPGGPPAFVTVPPGGGGGVIVPQPVVTQVPPPAPGTPAVPEPSSWATMLLGLAMMGRMVRRGGSLSPRR